MLTTLDFRAQTTRKCKGHYLQNSNTAWPVKPTRNSKFELRPNFSEFVQFKNNLLALKEAAMSDEDQVHRRLEGHRILYYSAAEGGSRFEIIKLK